MRGLGSERLDLPFHHPLQCLHLFICGRVAHVDVAPVAVHVLPKAAPHEYERHSIHARLPQAALVDVDCGRGVTAVRVRGRLVDPAGTGSVAAAADDPRSLELPLRGRLTGGAADQRHRERTHGQQRRKPSDWCEHVRLLSHGSRSSFLLSIHPRQWGRGTAQGSRLRQRRCEP